MTTYKCSECNSTGCYSDICEKCCEHSDVCHDDRICLICGKDMTEDLMCAAEYMDMER